MARCWSTGPEWVERAEVIQEKGTNRSKFFRGQVDKYTWVDLGSSYVLSDISAAFLWAQLRRRARSREPDRVWDAYHAAFEELEAKAGSGGRLCPSLRAQRAHVLPAARAAGRDRDAFIDGWPERVNAVFHYVPLHSSPAGQRYGRVHGELEVTDSISERLVRLPLWVGMTSATPSGSSMRSVRLWPRPPPLLLLVAQSARSAVVAT